MISKLKPPKLQPGTLEQMVEHLFQTKVVEMEKTRYDSPLVIGGFVGPGLVGLASVTYVIEQLGLAQIGHVKSQHIPPVAVFIGEKLRHPFRIYCDGPGKIIVIICEVPIDMEGLYEISYALLDWVEQIHAREIVVLDGIPVNGIPEQRQAVYVADEKRRNDMQQRGLGTAQAALIGGVGGSILNECLARRVSGVSLLTPSSINLPDPGAPLSLIKALNSAYGLSIDTKPLEENVAKFNEYLSTLSEQHKKLQEQGTGRPRVPETVYR